ncbi:MAG: inositol monophosphatase family protein [Erysipelothrix sp.]|nr:inositol monophosphatase family protein [Erysipelothrix sp.]
MEKWIEKIKDILKEAHRLILDSMKESLTIETKSNRRDLVTQVDKNVQKFITNQLETLFVNHKVVGEESYTGSIDLNGHVWIVDPIDGTANFVKQQKDYGILLSYYNDGIGQLGFILDGNTGDIYVAIKDQGVFVNDKRIDIKQNLSLKDSLISVSVEGLFIRNYGQKISSKAFGIRYKGAAVQDGLMVINGQTGAFLALQSGPWDFAAHIVFAKELGLKCLKLDGSNRQANDHGFCVFGQEEVCRELLEIVKGIDNENC